MFVCCFVSVGLVVCVLFVSLFVLFVCLFVWWFASGSLFVFYGFVGVFVSVCLCVCWFGRLIVCLFLVLLIRLF